VRGARLLTSLERTCASNLIQMVFRPQQASGQSTAKRARASSTDAPTPKKSEIEHGREIGILRPRFHPAMRICQSNFAEKLAR
jgi:hypothetical protein